jgi:DNA/RNA endonuclease YhcR with UshA esterase domain
MQEEKHISTSTQIQFDLFYLLTVLMQQASLFDASLCTQHTVSGNNITAIFQEKDEWTYDVVLSVSSHKFLLHIKPGWNEIEEFEVTAMRWYMDYNISLLHTLKKIMKHVCYGK